MDSLELSSTDGELGSYGELDCSVFTEELLESLSTSKGVNKLSITAKQAKANYDSVGELVCEDPEVITRDKFPEAFSPMSEQALAAVLAELELGQPLSGFQEVAVNGLLNGHDQIIQVPAGSGKHIFLILATSSYRE